jgi:heptosyltransferase-2
MLSYKKTYTLPFKFSIPNYTKEYLNQRSILSWFKYLKRYIYIYIKRQHKLELFNVTENHKDILWINFSAPSLGDSLMDLSSRILLSSKRVDLLTDKKNVDLYRDDFFFASVFSNKNLVFKKNYDLVIIDSFSTRSIKIKASVAFSTPYIGVYGYYNGPEVNRVLFSFHQLNNLLGYIKSEEEINDIAKCSISISSDDCKLIETLKLPKKYTAIVIGGEWTYRTYNNWTKLIQRLLIKYKSLNLVLLGSGNARKHEKEILQHFSTSNIVSYVAKLTFNQTAQVINKAEILFCCDGGLMHAANSLDTINISLLARLQAEMQLTKACKSFPFFDTEDVNNILVEDLIMKFEDVKKLLDYKH